MQCTLVAKTTLIAKSDDLQSRKQGQSVQFFSFNFFKKYRKSTAVLLIWKYRYRGTNFSKVPSTGTAVLLQSTVPTYDLITLTVL